MPVFDERPAPPTVFTKLRLLGLPLLLVLIGTVLMATRQPEHLRQSLRDFRGEASPASGPNISMDSSLTIRGLLLFHPHAKLNAAQAAALIASAAGPPDDQAQSEALDVLGLAQRANALSPAQAQEALAATLSVLRGVPGPMTRLEAARLLGHLGSAAGASALQLLLRDTDPKVQSAASEALAHLQK